MQVKVSDEADELKKKKNWKKKANAACPVLTSVTQQLSTTQAYSVKQIPLF